MSPLPPRDEHSYENWNVFRGAERDRLWALMVGLWPSFQVYQTRTTRRIPVVVLERTP